MQGTALLGQGTALSEQEKALSQPADTHTFFTRLLLYLFLASRRLPTYGDSEQKDVICEEYPGMLCYV